MADDQRRFSRIAFDAEIRLTQQPLQCAAQLVDISLKGALVLLPENCPLTTGRPVELELCLGDTGELCIHIRARVAHRDDRQVGLYFEHTDLESATELHRLLELNLGDARLLDRELAALGH